MKIGCHGNLHTKIAAIFVICDCVTQKSLAISETRKGSAALGFKVATENRLRFAIRAAISRPKAPPFCRISGDLAPSTWKSLAIVRF